MVAEYARRHPEMKQKEIGEKFGLSQSKVSLACLIDGYSRRATGETCRLDVEEKELRRKVAEVLKANPDMTLEAVGRQFGLTFEQVSYVADQHGMLRKRGRRLGYKVSAKTREAINDGRRRYYERLQAKKVQNVQAKS